MSSPTKINRKTSTNEKLAEFLNKSEIQDEEAEALDQEERRARDRLRITSLYGAGARFKTPKTKVLFHTQQQQQQHTLSFFFFLFISLISSQCL